MAYGQIHEKFWNDAKVRQLEPLQAYLFIYLFSNPHRHFSGVYYLRPTTIAEEMNLDPETVEQGLSRLEELEFIEYDAATFTIFVKNMLRYSHGQDKRVSPQQLQGIAKHLEGLERSTVFKSFVERYQGKFLEAKERQEDREKFQKIVAAINTLESLAAPPHPCPGAGARTGTGTEQPKSKSISIKEGIDTPIDRGMDTPMPGGDPPPPQKSKKDKQTPIPDNFSISERVRAWAKENNHKHLDRHLEAFKLKCQANGYQKVDWDAALMGAILENWAGIDPNAPEKREVPGDPDPNCSVCHGSGYEEVWREGEDSPRYRDCKCRYGRPRTKKSPAESLPRKTIQMDPDCPICGGARLIMKNGRVSGPCECVRRAKEKFAAEAATSSQA